MYLLNSGSQSDGCHVCTHSWLYFLATGIAQIQPPYVDVPITCQRQCEIPATITRDSNSDLGTFVLEYLIETKISLEGFVIIISSFYKGSL
ncbi:hypothetical protein GYMLUDRAFT_38391 [Collybiopsis luxurians FD-317 M1]|nr:hypothetical protein GYMLUDRAFT_38391 [Collybiopsis luxurians FD-317 M1]